VNHDSFREPAAAPPPVRATPVAPDPSRPLPRVLWLVPLAAAGALYYGWTQREAREARATTAQQEILQFVPRVRVTEARRNASPVQLVLPGATEAIEQATIRARATGYISERRVDIGSRVQAGEVLARIQAPELDQQLAQGTAQLLQTRAALAQARARLVQVRADLELAGLNNDRTAQLARSGFSTGAAYDSSRLGLAARQADVRNAEAGVEVADANVAAQRATVERLQQLITFTTVVAPFDGVITSRTIAAGDLVNADNTANPLFTIARDTVLRVRVQVPQAEATAVRDGLPVAVTVPDLPGRSFAGRIARNAVALTNASRSLTTEVDVPNPDGVLRPGMYVAVRLELPRAVPVVVVPSEAIVFDGEGTAVMTVGEGDVMRRNAVTIRRDFGREVELADGIQGGERVVLGPPVGLPVGSRVQPQVVTAPARP
jgi:HlyD family secretion protein